MKCDRCGEPISAGEEMIYYAQTLCEECYMQASSPTRACDPWAVRNAQKLTSLGGVDLGLSQTQASILKILEQTGGLEPSILAEKLRLKMPELERELATLRHMEKVRGQMRGGKKFILLWGS